VEAKEFALHQLEAYPENRYAYHRDHNPPLIGMYAEGRFAQLAHRWNGVWVKSVQEITINGKQSPDPSGWTEVFLEPR
jgi:hypothetical protein